MIRLVMAVVAVFLAVSGCGTKEPEAPPVPSADDRYGAPSVTSSRDVRGFAADPCRVLSSAALAQLGVQSPGQRQALASGESACAWKSADETERFGITVAANSDPLVDAYRSRQSPIFVPLDVAGLPGVSEVGATDAIICDLSVGTADGQGFVIDYTDPGRLAGGVSDPCGKAQRVAERVVAALPPLSAK